MNVDELNRILDREFQRLTDGGKAERRTVSDMAEFFGEGISASLLYKWKSGERDISRKGARQIAAAFRKGDPVAIEQLEKDCGSRLGLTSTLLRQI
jgi:N-acetylglucosamine kinase-like BadF-type ATPase